MGPNFAAYFILTQDSNFDAPTQTYCNQIKNNPQYKLPMPVLRDPTGTTIQQTFKIPANRDADIVLDENGVIQLKLEGGGGGAGGGEKTVGPVLDALLKP